MVASVRATHIHQHRIILVLQEWKVKIEYFTDFEETVSSPHARAKHLGSTNYYNTDLVL